MNKNTREEKTGKAPSNSEGLQPAEIEKDRDEDKNKKRGLLLRRITVALAGSAQPVGTHRQGAVFAF